MRTILLKTMKNTWLLLSLIALFTSASLQAEQSNNIGVELGQIAPDFTVSDIDGKTFKLSEYRGKKPVYLVFWATWCGTCKHEIPEFKALHKSVGDKIELLAVNVDHLSWWSALSESKNRVKKYVKKYELPYAVALDDKEQLISLFEVRGTPTQILIDKEGVIRRRYGLLNDKTKQVIKNLLEEA